MKLRTKIKRERQYREECWNFPNIYEWYDVSAPRKRAKLKAVLIKYNKH